MRPATTALVYMTLSALLIPVGDAFAKEISRVSSIEPQVIAFTRFFIGAAVFVPLAMASRGIPALTPRFVGAQLLRGVFVAGAYSRW